MSITTSGVEGADNEAASELSAIMNGGENFAARIVALQNHKKSYQDALAEFDLGRDARAAYNDAIKQQSDAVIALNEAKAKASDIINAANREAMSILADAQGKKEALAGDAAKIKAEADAYATKLRYDTDRDRDAAALARAEAEKTAANLATTQEESRLAKEELVVALEAARVAEEDFKSRINIIQNAANAVIK